MRLGKRVYGAGYRLGSVDLGNFRLANTSEWPGADLTVHVQARQHFLFSNGLG